MNKSHGGGGGGGGSCGGGGGGSRKASNRIWDDGDDFCVFTEPKRPSRPCDSNKSKGETRPKWKPKAKVPLQTLHMTSENQEKKRHLWGGGRQRAPVWRGAGLASWTRAYLSS